MMMEDESEGDQSEAHDYSEPIELDEEQGSGEFSDEGSEQDAGDDIETTSNNNPYGEGTSLSVGSKVTKRSSRRTLNERRSKSLQQLVSSSSYSDGPEVTYHRNARKRQASSSQLDLHQNLSPDNIEIEIPNGSKQNTRLPGLGKTAILSGRIMKKDESENKSETLPTSRNESTAKIPVRTPDHLDKDSDKKQTDRFVSKRLSRSAEILPLQNMSPRNQFSKNSKMSGSAVKLPLLRRSTSAANYLMGEKYARTASLMTTTHLPGFIGAAKSKQSESMTLGCWRQENSPGTSVKGKVQMSSTGSGSDQTQEQKDSLTGGDANENKRKTRRSSEDFTLIPTQFTSSIAVFDDLSKFKSKRKNQNVEVIDSQMSLPPSANPPPNTQTTSVTGLTKFAKDAEKERFRLKLPEGVCSDPLLSKLRMESGDIGIAARRPSESPLVAIRRHDRKQCAKKVTPVKLKHSRKSEHKNVGRGIEKKESDYEINNEIEAKLREVQRLKEEKEKRRRKKHSPPNPDLGSMLSKKPSDNMLRIRKRSEEVKQSAGKPSTSRKPWPFEAHSEHHLAGRAGVLEHLALVDKQLQMSGSFDNLLKKRWERMAQDGDRDDNGAFLTTVGKFVPLDHSIVLVGRTPLPDGSFKKTVVLGTLMNKLPEKEEVGSGDSMVTLNSSAVESPIVVRGNDFFEGGGDTSAAIKPTLIQGENTRNMQIFNKHDDTEKLGKDERTGKKNLRSFARKMSKGFTDKTKTATRNVVTKQQERMRRMSTAVGGITRNMRKRGKNIEEEDITPVQAEAQDTGRATSEDGDSAFYSSEDEPFDETILQQCEGRNIFIGRRSRPEPISGKRKVRRKDVLWHIPTEHDTCPIANSDALNRKMRELRIEIRQSTDLNLKKWRIGKEGWVGETGSKLSFDAPNERGDFTVDNLISNEKTGREQMRQIKKALGVLARESRPDLMSRRYRKLMKQKPAAVYCRYLYDPLVDDNLYEYVPSTKSSSSSIHQAIKGIVNIGTKVRSVLKGKKEHIYDEVAGDEFIDPLFMNELETGFPGVNWNGDKKSDSYSDDLPNFIKPKFVEDVREEVPRNNLKPGESTDTETQTEDYYEEIDEYIGATDVAQLHSTVRGDDQEIDATSDDSDMEDEEETDTNTVKEGEYEEIDESITVANASDLEGGFFGGVTEESQENETSNSETPENDETEESQSEEEESHDETSSAPIPSAGKTVKIGCKSKKKAKDRPYLQSNIPKKDKAAKQMIQIGRPRPTNIRRSFPLPPKIPPRGTGNKYKQTKSNELNYGGTAPSRSISSTSLGLDNKGNKRLLQFHFAKYFPTLTFHSRKKYHKKSTCTPYYDLPKPRKSSSFPFCSDDSFIQEMNEMRHSLVRYLSDGSCGDYDYYGAMYSKSALPTEEEKNQLLNNSSFFSKKHVISDEESQNCSSEHTSHKNDVPLISTGPTRSEDFVTTSDSVENESISVIESEIEQDVAEDFGAAVQYDSPNSENNEEKAESDENSDSFSTDSADTVESKHDLGKELRIALDEREKLKPENIYDDPPESSKSSSLTNASGSTKVSPIPKKIIASKNTREKSTKFSPITKKKPMSSDSSDESLQGLAQFFHPDQITRNGKTRQRADDDDSTWPRSKLFQSYPGDRLRSLFGPSQSFSNCESLEEHDAFGDPVKKRKHFPIDKMLRMVPSDYSTTNVSDITTWWGDDEKRQGKLGGADRWSTKSLIGSDIKVPPSDAEANIEKSRSSRSLMTKASLGFRAAMMYLRGDGLLLKKFTRKDKMPKPKKFKFRRDDGESSVKIICKESNRRLQSGENTSEAKLCTHKDCMYRRCSDSDSSSHEDLRTICRESTSWPCRRIESPLNVTFDAVKNILERSEKNEPVFDIVSIPTVSTAVTKLEECGKCPCKESRFEPFFPKLFEENVLKPLAVRVVNLAVLEGKEKYDRLYPIYTERDVDKLTDKMVYNAILYGVAEFTVKDAFQDVIIDIQTEDMLDEMIKDEIKDVGKKLIANAFSEAAIQQGRRRIIIQDFLDSNNKWRENQSEQVQKNNSEILRYPVLSDDKFAPFSPPCQYPKRLDGVVPLHIPNVEGETQQMFYQPSTLTTKLKANKLISKVINRSVDKYLHPPSEYFTASETSLVIPDDVIEDQVEELVNDIVSAVTLAEELQLDFSDGLKLQKKYPDLTEEFSIKSSSSQIEDKSDGVDVEPKLSSFSKRSSCISDIESVAAESVPKSSSISVSDSKFISDIDIDEDVKFIMNKILCSVALSEEVENRWKEVDDDDLSNENNPENIAIESEIEVENSQEHMDANDLTEDQTEEHKSEYNYDSQENVQVLSNEADQNFDEENPDVDKDPGGQHPELDENHEIPDGEIGDENWDGEEHPEYADEDGEYGAEQYDVDEEEGDWGEEGNLEGNEINEEEEKEEEGVPPPSMRARSKMKVSKILKKLHRSSVAKNRDPITRGPIQRFFVKLFESKKRQSASNDTWRFLNEEPECSGLNVFEGTSSSTDSSSFLSWNESTPQNIFIGRESSNKRREDKVKNPGSQTPKPSTGTGDICSNSSCEPSDTHRKAFGSLPLYVINRFGNIARRLSPSRKKAQTHCPTPSCGRSTNAEKNYVSFIPPKHVSSAPSPSRARHTPFPSAGISENNSIPTADNFAQNNNPRNQPPVSSPSTSIWERNIEAASSRHCDTKLDGSSSSKTDSTYDPVESSTVCTSDTSISMKTYQVLQNDGQQVQIGRYREEKSNVKTRIPCPLVMPPSSNVLSIGKSKSSTHSSMKLADKSSILVNIGNRKAKDNCLPIDAPKPLQNSTSSTVKINTVYTTYGEVDRDGSGSDVFPMKRTNPLPSDSKLLLIKESTQQIQCFQEIPDDAEHEDNENEKPATNDNAEYNSCISDNISNSADELDDETIYENVRKMFHPWRKDDDDLIRKLRAGNIEAPNVIAGPQHSLNNTNEMPSLSRGSVKLSESGTAFLDEIYQIANACKQQIFELAELRRDHLGHLEDIQNETPVVEENIKNDNTDYREDVLDIVIPEKKNAGVQIEISQPIGKPESAQPKLVNSSTYTTQDLVDDVNYQISKVNKIMGVSCRKPSNSEMSASSDTAPPVNFELMSRMRSLEQTIDDFAKELQCPRSMDHRINTNIHRNGDEVQEKDKSRDLTLGGINDYQRTYRQRAKPKNSPRGADHMHHRRSKYGRISSMSSTLSGGRRFLRSLYYSPRVPGIRPSAAVSSEYDTQFHLSDTTYSADDSSRTDCNLSDTSVYAGNMKYRRRRNHSSETEASYSDNHTTRERKKLHSTASRKSPRFKMRSRFHKYADIREISTQTKEELNISNSTDELKTRGAEKLNNGDQSDDEKPTTSRSSAYERRQAKENEQCESARKLKYLRKKYKLSSECSSDERCKILRRELSENSLVKTGEEKTNYANDPSRKSKSRTHGEINPSLVPENNATNESDKTNQESHNINNINKAFIPSISQGPIFKKILPTKRRMPPIGGRHRKEIPARHESFSSESNSSQSSTEPCAARASARGGIVVVPRNLRKSTACQKNNLPDGSQLSVPVLKEFFEESTDEEFKGKQKIGNVLSVQQLTPRDTKFLGVTKSRKSKESVTLKPSAHPEARKSLRKLSEDNQKQTMILVNRDVAESPKDYTDYDDVKNLNKNRRQSQGSGKDGLDGRVVRGKDGQTRVVVPSSTVDFLTGLPSSYAEGKQKTIPKYKTRCDDKPVCFPGYFDDSSSNESLEMKWMDRNIQQVELPRRRRSPVKVHPRSGTDFRRWRQSLSGGILKDRRHSDRKTRRRASSFDIEARVRECRLSSSESEKTDKCAADGQCFPAQRCKPTKLCLDNKKARQCHRRKTKEHSEWKNFVKNIFHLILSAGPLLETTIRLLALAIILFYAIHEEVFVVDGDFPT
ncbi:uncharacterized protein LOC120327567 isoform X2 [Styela clava]